jgi:hypothetical protein
MSVSEKKRVGAPRKEGRLTGLKLRAISISLRWSIDKLINHIFKRCLLKVDYTELPGYVKKKNSEYPKSGPEYLIKFPEIEDVINTWVGTEEIYNRVLSGKKNLTQKLRGVPKYAQLPIAKYVANFLDNPELEDDFINDEIGLDAFRKKVEWSLRNNDGGKKAKFNSPEDEELFKTINSYLIRKVEEIKSQESQKAFRDIEATEIRLNDLKQMEDDTVQEDGENNRTIDSVSAFITKHNRLIILGDPAAGKSTCLEREFIRYAESFDNISAMPIFISLLSFEMKTDFNNLFETIAEETGISKEDLSTILKDKKTLLLLDGLNECPARLQVYLKREINDFIRRYPHVGIVISGRAAKQGIDRTEEWMSKYNFNACQINPLDDQKQFELLEAYVGNEKAKSIIEQINSQPGEQTITNSPLIIYILSKLSQGGRGIPKGRAELYREYIGLWYHDHETRGDRHPEMERLGKIKQKLGYIALEMKLKDRSTEVDISELRGKSFYTKLSEIEYEPEEFLEDVGQGFPFKYNKTKGRFSFQHETFQDYLISEYIVMNQIVLDEIIGRKQPTQEWDMILVLAYELMEDPPMDFLEKALNIDWRIAIFFIAKKIGKENLFEYLEGHHGKIKSMREYDSYCDTVARILAKRGWRKQRIFWYKNRGVPMAFDYLLYLDPNVEKDAIWLGNAYASLKYVSDYENWQVKNWND